MPAKHGNHLSTVAAMGNKPPQQELILAIFKDNYNTGRTPDGEPFATGIYDAPTVAIPLRGRSGLRQRLAADMYELLERQPSSEALSTALLTIEGLCSQPPARRAALRVARAGDGNIILDLGRRDGQVAVIWPGGWELCPSAPVLFRRSAATLELPLPVRGGLTAEVGEIIKMRSRDEFALYSGCRVMSVLPEGTRPVEVMTGQPGSGKTTRTRITTRWLGGDMAAMPKDHRDWVAMAANAHVLGHDNVSSLSADRQDLLCKAASGDAHLARVLYTDADLFRMVFQPVSVIINGVEVGMLRSDFIRRSVSHYLLKLGRYWTDAEVAAAWERGHPAALGWLLDLTAAVLARMTLIPRPDGDSLADFAWVLAALDSLWGTRALDLWRDGQAELYAELAEGDPVAIAVRKTVLSPWGGTAGELLELMGERSALPTGMARPWTPRSLASALERAQAALEAAGWVVGKEKDPHTKRSRFGLWPPGTWPG
jgi:hypothetical protein